MFFFRQWDLLHLCKTADADFIDVQETSLTKTKNIVYCIVFF